MVPFLIDVELLDRSIVTVEVRQLLQGVRLPEDDVTLLSAASDLLLFDRVDKAIDALLVEIESLLGLIGEIRNIVHVDEAV